MDKYAKKLQHKFPSPCGDYGSYLEEQLGVFIYDTEFPSPCGDYGSYPFQNKS